MICVAKICTLSGGAPRSLLQYIKIIKKQGYDILTIAERGEEEVNTLYDECSSFVDYQDAIDFIYGRKKLFSAYNQMAYEFNQLKKIKPQLVIAVGAINTFYYSFFCNRLGIPFIGFIAGGDLSYHSYTVKQWYSCQVVCFSEENKQIINLNNRKCIPTVISNRISIKPYVVSETHNSTDYIRILVVSRLDNDKSESIKRFIDMVYRMSSGKKNKYEIRVAGDGAERYLIEEYVKKYESEAFIVVFLGHVTDLYSEFFLADCVVGKGRSVLEPIMLGIVGFVISDDGKIEICNTDNFNNLYEYNFSGRGLSNPMDLDSFSNTLERIHYKHFDSLDIKEIQMLVNNYYSTEYLEPKFLKIMNEITSTVSNPKSCIGDLFLYTINFIRNIFAMFKQLVKRSINE